MSADFNAVIGVNIYTTETRTEHASYDEAVEHLTKQLNLGWFKRHRLYYEGYVKLNRRRTGSDYCYIVRVAFPNVIGISQKAILGRCLAVA